jgi:MFS family permease
MSEVVTASDTARPERPPTPAGFWTLWTTVALDLIGFGIIVPILALYAERFGASPWQTGLLLSSFSAAQFVGAPLLGMLSDRVGRKPVIIVSLLGTALGSVVTGAAGALWVLYAGRIIDGASGASLSVARAAVADLAPAGQRTRLLGLLGAAFGVGFVVGPALGGLASLAGPSAPFYVAAGLALVNAVAATVRLPETRTARTVAAGAELLRGPGRRLRPATPALWRWAIIGFVSTLAFVAFESTFSLFGKRRFGLTEGSASLVFLGVGLFLTVLQGVVYGRVVHRVGVATAFRGGLAVVAAGLIALSMAREWWLLLVALALITVGQAMASPSINVLVADLAAESERGRVMGTQESSYALGRIVGPLLATAAFGSIGVWSPYLGAALMLFAALGMVALWKLAPARL